MESIEDPLLHKKDQNRVAHYISIPLSGPKNLFLASDNAPQLVCTILAANKKLQVSFPIV